MRKRVQKTSFSMPITANTRRISLAIVNVRFVGYFITQRQLHRLCGV